MDDRIKLGIDGNCAFALYGENLQEGEAEFVEIENFEDDQLNDKLVAAKIAYHRLKVRLNKPDLTFYFGKSLHMEEIAKVDIELWSVLESRETGDLYVVTSIDRKKSEVFLFDMSLRDSRWISLESTIKQMVVCPDLEARAPYLSIYPDGTLLSSHNYIAYEESKKNPSRLFFKWPSSLALMVVVKKKEWDKLHKRKENI